MASVLFGRFRLFATRRNGVFLMRFRSAHKDSKIDDIQVRNAQNLTSAERYPEVQKLQLPLNFRVLPSSEGMSFMRQRTRDISGTCIETFFQPARTERQEHYGLDSRIGKYCCSNAVDLSSSMQTNVPYPFRPKSKPTHLNMPRGQWRQQAKYMSEQLHTFHPVNLPISSGVSNKGVGQSVSQPRIPMSVVQTKRYYSEEVKRVNETVENPKNLTYKQKLKAAIMQYGLTVLVLHISISLISLGTCYTLVCSGVNISEIVEKWGWSEGAATAGSVGPFVVAYALHKVIMPFRITLTLTLTPVVVNFLKKKGFKLKK